MSEPTSNGNGHHQEQLVCPHCGGRLREPRGLSRLINRGLVCDQCGFSMLLNEAVHEALRQRVGGSESGVETGVDSGPRQVVLALEARIADLSARVGRIEHRIDTYGIPTAVIEPSAPIVVAEPETIVPAEATATEPVPEILVERLEALQAAAEAGRGPQPAETIAMPEAALIAPEAPKAVPVELPAMAEHPARKAVPRRDLEELVGGRGLAFTGGLAILLGAVFFLSLAFSRGWIGPNLRVIIGVVSATAMILGGSRFFGRREALFGHVLTATGLGVMSLSMIAATRLYDLISVELGVAGMLAAAVLAAVIAIRVNLQVVAAYGIVSALVAPPVLGAEPNGVMIALIAAALVGTTAISLYRTWVWLPSMAFVLSAPQLADWLVSEPALRGALPALGAFWLLHAISAGGEAYRFKESHLRPTAASLLVADAAYLIWGGFELLTGNNTDWRGTFLLAVAIAHGGLGAWFMRERGDRNPFGMLAFGTGVAALTMAAPIQFGAPVVPLAWAAEGVALAWLSWRLRNPFGGAASAIMGALAIAHLGLLEYPFHQLLQSNDSGRPFVNANGLAAGFVTLALAVAAYVVRIATVRQTLAAVGIALAAYVMPYEVSGHRLVVDWSLLTIVGIALFGLRPLAAGAGLARVPGSALLIISTTTTWIVAAVHLVFFEYPLDDVREGLDRDLPFMHTSGLALLLLLAAAAAAVWRLERPTDRLVPVYAGFALLLYVVPFEFSGTLLVGVWSALAIAATVAAMRVPWLGAELTVDGAGSFRDPWRPRLAALGMTLPMLTATALAMIHVVTINYPSPSVFDDYSARPPFLNADGLALLFVLAANTVAGFPARRMNRIRGVAAWSALLLWAMPFELSGVALVGAAAFASVIALAAGRWSPLQVPAPTAAIGPLAPMERLGLGVVAVVAWSFAAVHWLVLEMIDAWLDETKTTPLFRDGQTLAAACLIVAALLAALVARDRAIQSAGSMAALTTAAILMPYELGSAATVVAWSALALVAMLMNERDTFTRRPYLVATAVLIGLSMLTTLGEVAPPDRLAVDGLRVVDHPLLWSGASAALGALAIVFTVIRWRYVTIRRAHLFGIAAGAMTVYLLSIGVVDHFQGQLAEVGLDSLQKRAQVALSILWAVLGGGVFAGGIIEMRRPLRISGLGLLGLATGKVFIYDLASLDTSYRVLSLIGLGVLLLISSFLYQRFVAPLDRDGSDHHGAEPPAATGLVPGA